MACYNVIARFFLFCYLFHCFVVTLCFPDQGRWSFVLNQKKHYYIGVPKSLYKGSKVLISVLCENSLLTVGWVLRQTACYDEYMGISNMKEDGLRSFYDCPIYEENSNVRYLKFETSTFDCSHPKSLQTNFSTFEEHLYPQNCAMKKTEEDKEIPPVTIKGKEKREAPDQNQKVSEIKNKSVAAKSNNKITVTENPTIKSTGTEKNNVKKDKITSSITSFVEVTKETTSPKKVSSPENISSVMTKGTVAVVDQDGMYLLIVYIDSEQEPVNISVDIQMKGDYGYLSAADWPLLPFYGVMCGIYVIYAVGWLVVSALQWRDLLRIQFWIGGVIFIGLMEKAMFYAEYQSINSTGQSVQGAVLFAEILSCMKRTLARMLVVIVSLGFGIVKPRLGPLLHRVVGMGALYFMLATIEGCLRAIRPKYDQSNQKLMASIPLAVLDSAICWWIFSSLVQTTRTLCLRRNIVKLSLFRHFTNTLIFAVLASVIYMIWSVHNYKFTTCITDWKELWVDEAYWHLLFSVLLLVIMILWRPTNNNQRYAFTPLLDAADDDDDDQDQTVSNDAFAGMKMRASKNQSNSSPKQNDKSSKAEDDLKWVEENIPSSLSDTALPSLLDSDEEIMTAKFERSKME